MIRFRLLVLLVASVWLLTACNTVQGFGKDMQKVGDKVEDAAKKK